jgi:hypothetical protein
MPLSKSIYKPVVSVIPNGKVVVHCDGDQKGNLSDNSGVPLYCIHETYFVNQTKYGRHGILTQACRDLSPHTVSYPRAGLNAHAKNQDSFDSNQWRR